MAPFADGMKRAVDIVLGNVGAALFKLFGQGEGFHRRHKSGQGRGQQFQYKTPEHIQSRTNMCVSLNKRKGHNKYA